jgi:uncharacterized integral membrane protein
MSDERYDDEERPSGTGSSGPSIWLISFAVLAICGTIFAFQNSSEVPTQFLWLDGQFKYWVTILASIGLGVILDRLILTWWRRSRRKD